MFSMNNVLENEENTYNRQGFQIFAKLHTIGSISGNVRVQQHEATQDYYNEN